MKSANDVTWHWGEVPASVTTVAPEDGRKPHSAPQGGDTVDTEIDGIGHVENRVVPDGWVC